MKGIAGLRVAGLLGAAALAAACSDSSTGLVVKSFAPDTTAPLLEVFVRMPLYTQMRNAALLTGASLPAVIVPVPASCAFSTASKRFSCAPITSGTDTVAQSFALFDAAGSKQSKYDATTTASVELATSIIGSSSTGGLLEATVQWQQDLTISGLLTSAQALNGIANIVTTGATTNATGSSVFIVDTVRQTISGIALPNSGSTKYPLAGSITTVLTSVLPAISPSASSYQQMQMTFNGTSLVTMVFGDGRHCILDLSGATALICS